MNLDELQQLFTNTLKSKLVGNNEITDVRVKIISNSEQLGEMPWESVDYNELIIDVQYNNKKEMDSIFVICGLLLTLGFNLL